MITVEKLADALGARIAALGDGTREIACGYCGDFLSNVMGKAPADCAWFTVMSNVNVCAVATLTDCAVVVLCEGTEPDPVLLERAQQNEVNVIITALPVYEAAVKLNEYLTE